MITNVLPPFYGSVYFIIFAYVYENIPNQNKLEKVAT